MAILNFTTLVLLSLLHAVQGQTSINPSSVPISTREYWCQQQKTECPLICLQTPSRSDQTRQNSCDPTTLTYSCICSLGNAPNVTHFSQTLPYFVCTEWGNQCVAACGAADARCAAACRQNHPCGAQAPFRGNASASRTAAEHAPATTAAAAGGSVCTGFGEGSCAQVSASVSGSGAVVAGSFFAGSGSRSLLGVGAVVVAGCVGLATLL